MSTALRVKTDHAPTVVPLLHRRSRSEARRSIRLAALRVPLTLKLVGANLAVVALFAAIWVASGHAFTLSFAGVLAGAVLLHVLLVFVALRPIRDLEQVATRVWQGDFGARVERSAVADHEVLRIGAMFNILLDGLVSDRAR